MKTLTYYLIITLVFSHSSLFGINKDTNIVQVQNDYYLHLSNYIAESNFIVIGKIIKNDFNKLNNDISENITFKIDSVLFGNSDNYFDSTLFINIVEDVFEYAPDESMNLCDKKTDRRLLFINKHANQYNIFRTNLSTFFKNDNLESLLHILNTVKVGYYKFIYNKKEDDTIICEGNFENQKPIGYWKEVRINNNSFIYDGYYTYYNQNSKKDSLQYEIFENDTISMFVWKKWSNQVRNKFSK